jgi:hypothetical protein
MLWYPVYKYCSTQSLIVHSLQMLYYTVQNIVALVHSLHIMFTNVVSYIIRVEMLFVEVIGYTFPYEILKKAQQCSSNS